MVKLNQIIVLLILCLTSCGSNTTWEKIYGGQKVDIATDIIELSEDNIFVLGYSSSFSMDDLDIWLLSLNKYGNINWDKKLGDKHSNVSWSLTYTKNNNIMFAGSTKTITTKNDIIIFKMDASGKLIKKKIYNIKGNENIQSIISSDDGGCLLIGNIHIDGDSGSRCLVIKISEDGEKEWLKIYHDFVMSSGQNAIQTDNGDYIISAIIPKDSFVNIDTLIFRINKKGDIQWSKTIGGTAFDILSDIKQTVDNNYILTGYTMSKGNGLSDLWVVKINNQGNVLMDKTFGGAGADQGKSLVVTDKNEYVITGWTESKGAGSSDIWIIKLNSEGNIVWDKTYGYERLEWSYSINKTQDGGYIISGITMSKGKGDRDYYILKLNSAGNL